MLSLRWPLTSVLTSLVLEIAEAVEAVDTCLDGVVAESLGRRVLEVKLGVADVKVAADV